MDLTPASTDDRPVDPLALARVQQRLLRALQAPWLHTEAARRMAERLPVIKRQPQQVLDWGSHLGGSQALLQQAYPQAKLCAVEPDPARCQATAASLVAPWWSARRWRTAAAVACLPEQVPEGQAELLWCNMHLHGVRQPQALMAQWQRALAVEGFLMFSTFGPGTLQALRELYAQAGWGPPMAPLVDMHDLGDMLVQAGFADPVMDQETLTLTWASPEALLSELRSLGGNAALDRHAGLRTPRWRDRLLQTLADGLCPAGGAAAGAAPRLALGFELVYGHAFKGLPRAPVAAETALSVDEFRRMARSGLRRVSSRTGAGFQR